MSVPAADGLVHGHDGRCAGGRAGGRGSHRHCYGVVEVRYVVPVRSDRTVVNVIVSGALMMTMVVVMSDDEYLDAWVSAIVNGVSYPDEWAIGTENDDGSPDEWVIGTENDDGSPDELQQGI